MSTPLSRPGRREDRYRARWPTVFSGLAEWQVRAVVQRLENAALEGLRPTEADAQRLVDAHADVTDPNAYIRRVLLYPIRPGPE